jgi:hypothetical protein
MPSRNTETIVTFRHVFSIGPGLINQPPGSYLCVSEEELIEGISFTAYRAVSTTLQLPAVGTPGLTKQFVPISGTELRAALASDQLQTEGAH